MKGEATSGAGVNRLTKAVLIVVTTLCGSLKAAPPDRTADETTQLDSYGSSVETKASSRRTVAVIPSRLLASPHRELVESIDQPGAGMSLAPANEEVADRLDVRGPFQTCFGAGSFALSALGQSASVPHSRS
ncbi:hypothetical protein OKW29_005842 [Paraburkholderia sp. CI3]